MKRRLSLALVLSLAVHAALVAGVAALLATDTSRAIFVDLVQGWSARADVGEPSGDGRPPGGDGRPRGAAPAPSRQRAPAAAPERAAPSAASAPAPAPQPEPSPVAPAPSAPMAAPAPAAPPSPPAEPLTLALEPPPPPTASRGGAGERPASDATSRDAAGGATTGGGASAEQGSPGSSTAPGRDGAATGEGTGSGLGPGARESGALALAIPGAGGGEGAEYASYYAMLRRRVQELLKYPAVAARRELTGTAQVEMEIQPTGVIVQVALVGSSSHAVLDEAALDAVRAIERLPFPPGVRPARLRVRMPVVFELRRR